MRIIVAFAMLALAACDQVNLEEAKSGAADLGQRALEVAANAVDVRTACTLAGQSEAYCGCLQERAGSEISPEAIEAVGTVVRRTIAGEGMEAAVEGATGLDQQTRDALIQCAAQPAAPTADQAAE
jgi:hypothetical protein